MFESWYFIALLIIDLYYFVGTGGGGNPPAPASFAAYAGALTSAAQRPGYEREVQDFIQRSTYNEDYEKKVELFLQRVTKG